MSEVVGDEPAVVGEPASHPHQAAVVGEPPEEAVPVLGEPVLLANGLQNEQQPASSPSPDQSAVNGVHGESSSTLEPPSQSSDAPSSTASSAEGPNSAMVEEQAASGEVTSRSATENPVLSESSTEVPDAVLDSNDANLDADASVDAEVTHIADVPSEPSPPESGIAVENPFSALEEDSTGSGLKVSVDGDDGAVAAVADEQAISAVEKGESTKGVDPSAVDAQEPSRSSHEEILEGSGSTAESSENSTPMRASEEPTTESDEKTNVVSGGIKALNTTDPQQEDTSTKEVDVGGPSPDEAGEEALDSTKDLASTGDEKGQEDDKIEESSTKSGATVSELEHVESREASLVEAIPKGDVHMEEGEVVDASIEASPSEAEKVVSREAVLPEAFSSEKVGGDDQATPDSSPVDIDKDASAEGLRAIDVEESIGDQPPSDEAVLGENGFQYSQDGIPAERDQCLTKDEKSSSRFKVPVMCTLAIAVVGVAVAAISRSRQ